MHWDVCGQVSSASRGSCEGEELHGSASVLCFGLVAYRQRYGKQRGPQLFFEVMSAVVDVHRI